MRILAWAAPLFLSFAALANPRIGTASEPAADHPAVVLTPEGLPAAGAQVAVGNWTTVVKLEDGKLSYVGGAAERGLTIMETDAAGRFPLPAAHEAQVFVVAHETGYAEVDDPRLVRGAEGKIGGDETPQSPQLRIPLGRCEDRAFTHPAEAGVRGRHRYKRLWAAVQEIRTDLDLTKTVEALRPRDGEPIYQDQRFGMPIAYEFRSNRTSKELLQLIDIQRRKPEMQGWTSHLTMRIAQLVGRPAPELPAEGWIAGSPRSSLANPIWSTSGAIGALSCSRISAN